MSFRKLRIASSAFCGLACLLLIVLWVRSYYWSDVAPTRIPIPSTYITGFYSNRGTVKLAFGTPLPTGFVDQKVWEIKTQPATTMLQDGTSNTLGFGTGQTKWASIIRIPFWFGALVFALLSALPSLRWRKQFSLRTVLITTTLVALVLGFAVYAARK